MNSQVTVSSEWNLGKIARNAGAVEFFYRKGTLFANCTQDELLEALAAYDHEAEVAAHKELMFTIGVQAHMDAVAQSYGYDNIRSAVSYATSTDINFGPEGVAFRDWRDEVWNICTSLLNDWQNGGAEPTLSDVIEGLPAFVV